MEDQITVEFDSQGVCYRSTKERLIGAALATKEMFPGDTEMWRGNGPCREAHEPLWSVQRIADNTYKVMWGLCADQTTD